MDDKKPVGVQAKPANLENAYIMVAGFYGVGKTTAANKIGGKLGYVVYSTDQMRRELGIGVHDNADSTKIWSTIYGRVAERLREGEGAIVETTYFGSRTRLYDYMMTMVNQIPTIVVEVHCPDDVLLKRLEARGHNFKNINADKPQNYEEDIRRMKEKWEPLSNEIATYGPWVEHVSFLRYDNSANQIQDLLVRDNAKALVETIEEALL